MLPYKSCHSQTSQLVQSKPGPTGMWLSTILLPTAMQRHMNSKSTRTLQV